MNNYPSFIQEDTISDIININYHKNEVKFGGRISNLRGSKTAFLDIYDSEYKIQVVMKAEYMNNFTENIKICKRGNIVGVTGFIKNTQNGQRSVFAYNVMLLAPYCAEGQLPVTLTNKDIRFSQRYVDLIVNRSKIDIFIKRAKVVKSIRHYLDSKGYIEVETPILESKPSGATAKPFLTYHNELDQSMSLRIAPELNLKRCITGGMNRVYEIGKNFRNEGINNTHNPEFTCLEFYQAFSDCNEMMVMTEQIVVGAAGMVSDEKIINGIDFNPPFKIIDIGEHLSNLLGIPFSKIISDLHIICKNFNLRVDNTNPAKLLDSLIERFIEPECKTPTFIVGHPDFMSPLAKCKEGTNISDRFELFVNGFELANGYTEQNNPEEQQKAFVNQVKMRSLGDEEAMLIDDDFINCLKHGMPPTGGCGIGIDRLMMLLTGEESIKEVILFPKC